MKLKSLVAAASFLLFGAAQAAVTTISSSTPVYGPSFANFSIGDIIVGATSNIDGSVFAAESLSGNFTFGSLSFPFVLTLDSVTFSGATVASLTDTNSNPAQFHFNNVAAGTYALRASGTLGTTGQLHNVAYLGANYTAAPVPEPETYGMLLAGLGMVGFMARRKAAKKVA